MQTVKIILPRPHAAQRKIKTEAGRFNVVCCGRRFGKSTLGEDLVIETALAGYPAAWFTDKFASLDNPWRDLKRILRPVIAEKNETLRRIDLVTGGSIKMWSLDDDPECSRGPKYKRVVIDEAAKCAKLLHAWREAIRANLADYEGDAWFLSTPRGRNDFWQMFQYGLDEMRPDWACWQMGTGANPFIPIDEIDAMRQEMGAVVASQEIDAQFLEVGGRFFDEWDETRHTCLPFAIPRHWHFFGGIDYGTRASSPTFCFLLCAADEAGNVYVIDELYKAGALPSEQADAVAEVIDRHTDDRQEDGRQGRLPHCLPHEVMIAFDWANTFPPEDPAERIGEYPVESFWAKGLRCVRAVKDREAGWTRVKEFLHKPGALTVFRGRCPNLIRTLPLMVYDERLGHLEDLDTTLEDHPCLIAGTSVTTDLGNFPIEAVKAGDQVLTRKGYRKVLAAGLTANQVDVTTVAFSNGCVLTGTPNHTIWVQGKGFTKLSSLCYNDTVITVQEAYAWQGLRTFGSRELSTGAIPKAKDSVTASILDAVRRTIRSTVGARCTGISGLMLSAQSLMGTISTIETATRSTIILRTLNAFHEKNTHRAILSRLKKDAAGRTKSILRAFDLKRLIGTDRKKDVRGTASMAGKRGSNASQSHGLVCSAVGNIKALLCVQTTAFAVTNANRLIEGLWGRTMKPAYAQNADGSFSLTTTATYSIAANDAPALENTKDLACAELANIAKKNTKPEAQNLCFAQTHVVSVKQEEKKADVYNLAVEGEPEFFANGILTHNCDSLRYALMTRPRPATAPQPMVLELPADLRPVWMRRSRGLVRL